ncbi:pyruvyl transferase EpsO [Kineococcus radiotolerans]|uniref:Pyruvyl transferase EpsO n=1 Tax=Kineococcus radiotolerans TaxID=131568 RepID=A0A7W4TNE4_KINRA|nr:polysaccharide pyruvyl transferase family protein [Kineococcus radiotolerans]MBB2902005.1 pyruvyl transferase EpsO [Kineococcus radiotolerans]
MPSGSPDTTGRTPSVVDALRTELLARLETALPAGHPSWTVVDFPMHLNCGDSALHLGVEAVAAARGASIRRIVDRKSYSASVLSPESLPVLMAGGTWGGLYPTHHELRLRFLRDTAGRPAVQMAQSIQYVDETHREQLRRAVGEHGAFVLLVRDERSRDIAERDYDCEVRMVPDLAFALGGLQRLPASVPLVVQAREDKESGRPPLAGESFDWLKAPPRSRVALTLRAARRLNRFQTTTPAAPVAAVAAAGMRRLARANVDRARHLLSRGERVVTDRLHGHVLSTLLGIPHVVVNDKFGKVRALHETWLSEDPTSVFAASWAEVDGALEVLDARR